MQSLSRPVKFLACMSILAAAILSTAEDDIDPAFQSSGPDGPLSLVPENYTRLEWRSRYIDDVTSYLEKHPTDPYAARLSFDLFLVAKELSNTALEQQALEFLLLNRSRSIQARQALDSFQTAKHYLEFMKRCIGDGELSSETSRRLVPVMEYGSKKWGSRLWSGNDKLLYAATICAREFTAIETRAALEEEFAAPGRYDLQHLLETLDDDEATSAELIAAIFDSGIDYRHATKLFLPELKRRDRAEGAAAFFEKIDSAFESYDKKQYEEFLAEVTKLGEIYPSKRLMWAQIFMLTNRGEIDSSQSLADALQATAPRSSWTVIARELVDSCDGADERLKRQSEILAAVAKKSGETYASQFRVELQLNASTTLEGEVIPAVSFIGTFGERKEVAFQIMSGDETLGLAKLEPDNFLSLYLPSFDPSRILRHPGKFPQPSIEVLLEYDSEENSSSVKLEGGFASDEKKQKAPPFRLKTSFPQDSAGVRDFLLFERSNGIHSISETQDGELIEYVWKRYSPFRSSATEMIWRSTVEGDQPVVIVRALIASTDGSLSISWGGENSGVCRTVEYPDLPRHQVALEILLPRYLEAYLKWAKRSHYLRDFSDDQIASVVASCQNVIDSAYRRPLENQSALLESLQTDERGKESPKKGTKKSRSSLLDSILPGDY